ncbi:MAG: hypothetical protein NWP69_10895 [Congregibacter sp.]|nr:hypothetical protein [Congregibacter sp.]
MMYKSITALLLLFPVLGFGQSLGMQSDWLELVKGHRDGKSGAQVMDIKTDPTTGHQTAMVKVPKVVLLSETNMEEVRVVAQAPQKMEMPDLLPELETEWIDDYDNDHYGLLVKLRSDQKIPFRLFFSANGQGGVIDGAVQP